MCHTVTISSHVAKARWPLAGEFEQSTQYTIKFMKRHFPIFCELTKASYYPYLNYASKGSSCWVYFKPTYDASSCYIYKSFLQNVEAHANKVKVLEKSGDWTQTTSPPTSETATCSFLTHSQIWITVRLTFLVSLPFRTQVFCYALSCSGYA